MMRAMLLLGLAASTYASSGTSSLSFDMEDAKNRPVSKVITLLKDMKAELEAEAQADQEVYDTFACWCETNDKEKSKAIADAEAKIKDLNLLIEELTATSARLTNEIATLEGEVGKNQGTLAKANEMRMKDQHEFNGEENDLLQSIKSLKSAITVLSKHHAAAGAALLQIGASERQMMQVATVLDHELQKHAAILEGVLTRKQRKTVMSFVQQAPSAGSYAPASGQILGILKQMLETFESNLSQTQKDEQQGSDDYENLKASKESELAAGGDQIETKYQELATTDEKNAQAKTDLEDTEASLAADQKFLANLRAQCAAMDAEWEARSKVRADEMEAVAKAMEILSGDDAHDLFTKTFNFIQREAKSRQSKRREAASKLLRAVAQKTGNPKLVTLALQIRLDAFTKVKKAIDDMVAELMKQQADEVKLKDYCVEALNENLRQTQDKERTKKTLEETIEDLTMTIEELTESIATLKSEIKEMQFQMTRAGEDREKENVEFQNTVANQRATQKLLNQALEVLKGFYAKKAKAAFMQKGKQTPPAGFKAYKKNESSGGVMGMIQAIIDDAKHEEQETITAEADAQKAYESFVKDTNASIESKTKDMVNKSEEKARAEEEKIKSEETLAKTMTDLQGLSEEAADLHGECDFTLKNFEIRQSSRMQEIEALKQVKAILSGAKFSEFMQSDAFADDGSSVVDDGSSQENADPLDAYLN
jgi:chromosome segregation ATPase